MLLQLLGEEIVRLKRPFLVGGDANLTPELMAQSGFLEAVDGCIVAPEEHTCTSGFGRAIDFSIIGFSGDGQSFRLVRIRVTWGDRRRG